MAREGGAHLRVGEVALGIEVPRVGEAREDVPHARLAEARSCPRLRRWWRRWRRRRRLWTRTWGMVAVAEVEVVGAWEARGAPKTVTGS